MPDDEIKTGEVAIREPSIIDIIGMAVNKLDGEGAEATVAVIERLVDLKIKTDKINAEKEFNKAFAEFQAECPQIKKTSYSKKGATRGGGDFAYTYAELDEIERTIKPLLYKRGFSFSWDTKTIYDNEIPILTCVCCLKHRNGHSTTANFSIPVVKEVGSMNPVQRHSTVKTYGKRQTLVDVLGLTTTEADTDGVSPETIDEKQLQILKSAIKSSGADETKLCKYLEVDKVENLRKADFATAVMAVREKEKRAEKPTKPEPIDAIDRATVRQIKKLKIQITDIQNRKDELGITQPRINNYKTIIDNPMTFEEADKLSITLKDIQESGI